LEGSKPVSCKDLDDYVECSDWRFRYKVPQGDCVTEDGEDGSMWRWTLKRTCRAYDGCGILIKKYIDDTDEYQRCFVYGEGP